MFMEYGSEIMAVCVVLFCMMFATLIIQHIKIKNLNKKLDNCMEYLNTKYYDSAYINAMHKSLERSYNDLYKAVNTTLDNFHSYSDKNKEEIMKTYECINEIGKDIAALDARVEKCEIKFNANDYDNTDTATDIPVYKWIFPDEKPDAKKVVGELYLAIGYVYKTDETIKSYNAEWDGQRFVITDDGPDHAQYFDKVYAYIRMPDPSDIMTEVITKIIEKEKT